MSWKIMEIMQILSTKHDDIEQAQSVKEMLLIGGDNNEETDSDISLSQSNKTKIQNAVKNGKLQGLFRSSPRENHAYQNSSKILGSVLDKDPDDTDDFCGGATPYRAVINKNIVKT